MLLGKIRGRAGDLRKESLPQWYSAWNLTLEIPLPWNLSYKANVLSLWYGRQPSCPQGSDKNPPPLKEEQNKSHLLQKDICYQGRKSLPPTVLIKGKREEERKEKQKNKRKNSTEIMQSTKWDLDIIRLMYVNMSNGKGEWHVWTDEKVSQIK